MSEHVSTYAINLPKKKLCICIFNRATYARCKSVIKELIRFPNIELSVVLSSSLLMPEFGNAAKEYIESDHDDRVKFTSLEITYPDFTGYGAAKAMAQIQDKLADYFKENTFDAVIVVADRFETLPAAATAAVMNIPVVHIQGGETTGNIDDRIRHAVTKLSDYHFVATDLAKDYVVRMGEEFKRVFHTGCPSIDLISSNRIKRWVPKEKYIICIFHPETENVTEAYAQTKLVLETVLDYCMQYGQKCYWFYPNPDPGRMEVIRLLDSALKEHSAFLVKAINKDPVAFLKQLAGARLIIGNSSCGIRESSYLGLPAIDIGDRQAYRERAGNVITCGYDKGQIKKAMVDQNLAYKHKVSRLFGQGRAGEFIAKYIALKIDFMLKGTLSYPFSFKFKERHFGEGRFDLQKANRLRHIEKLPGGEAIRTEA